eukprot:CAMPEP_0179029136 /NCGR_PEP_ID=MMETSP0796-20121207/9901_1 /TAXON_ID=73915 /ORGANISM="Pyrodinium bahamense, Strain pbaha01" /LENGTH=223 /DNA_ID=CAMNT_0020725291 /DNA_START=68 /DNA_END=736 /DNA_ORIENTATION=-
MPPNCELEHALAVLFFGAMVCAAVVFLLFFVSRLCPRLDTPGFRAHIVLFCMVHLLLSTFSVFYNKELTTDPPDVIMTPSTCEPPCNNNNLSTFYNNPNHGGRNGTTFPYPVCTTRLGNHSNGDFRLSVLDFAVLSLYSYAKNDTDFKELVSASYGGHATVLEVTNFMDIPRMAVVRFNASGSEGTIVVAVKGTSTAKEAFADLGMYTNMAVLQMMDKVSPLL